MYHNGLLSGYPSLSNNLRHPLTRKQIGRFPALIFKSAVRAMRRNGALRHLHLRAMYLPLAFDEDGTSSNARLPRKLALQRIQLRLTSIRAGCLYDRHSCSVVRVCTVVIY